MSRGRPPKRSRLVEGLDGSDQAKLRLKVILQTLTGECTVEQACEQLGIKEGQTTEDMEYSLETVACIGACGLSPCLTINKKVHAKMTRKRIKELFAKGGGQ